MLKRMIEQGRELAVFSSAMMSLSSLYTPIL